MTPSVYLKILDEAKAFMPVIGIVGGEPLLYPHFDDLLCAITSRGMHASLTTNGCLLAEKAETIVMNRLPILGISIDGPPMLHDSIAHSEGSFERARKGIERIRELKRVRNSPYPRIKLILTICSLNQHRITESIRQMIDLEPDIVSVRHPISTSPASIRQSPSQLFNIPCGLTVPFGGRDALTDYREFDGKHIADQLDECIGLLQKNSIQFSIEPSMSRSDTENFYNPTAWKAKKRQCWVPWNLLEVMPNGDTVFCGLHFMHVTGNILRQSIDEIWWGKNMRNVRHYLCDFSPFPVCSRCCMTFADL